MSESFGKSTFSDTVNDTVTENNKMKDSVTQK